MSTELRRPTAVGLYKCGCGNQEWFGARKLKRLNKKTGYVMPNKKDLLPKCNRCGHAMRLGL